MERSTFLVMVVLVWVVSCGPNITRTVVPQPTKISPSTGAFLITQTTSADKKPETTRPPSPNEYCWNTTGTVSGPAEPPSPFLYQPFSGSLSAKTWSSQMDHDQPNYRQNGKTATLGEVLRYDTHAPGLAGGTQIPGGREFPYDVPYSSLLKQGYYILAYQSPSFEYYLYYDGHDGHDFAISGNALAAADGKVVFKGNYGNRLGRVVEIYHPQGYLTRYAHLANFDNKLDVGTGVKAGQSIGDIGGSAVIGGKLADNYWGVHLHFSVFRWNKEKGTWQITDPFGWDPWAGPDLEHRLKKQREDPLAQCNGEISYDLWTGEWPQPYGQAAVTERIRPTQDRYVGGWLGEEPEATVQPPPKVPTVTVLPSTSTPLPRPTNTPVPPPTHTPTLPQPTNTPKPTATPVSTKLNVADASASSAFPPQDANGYWARNTIDGNITTLWISLVGDTVGAWLELRLSESKTITGIRVYSLGSGDNGGRLKEATVIFSDSSQQKIYLDDARGWQYRNISPLNTTRVRIVATGIYPGKVFNDLIIAEIELLGR